MATLQEILARAQALREETELGSISPERAGSIMYDTLQQINQMQLLGASLVISKIYASVAAMEADSAPVSDLSGNALKEGQLVVIVPSDTSSSDMGSVYRFDGIEDSASTWSFTGKIGGYPMDETPTEGSTRAVTSGGVYSEVSQLAQEVHNLSGKYYGIFEDAESLPEGDAVGYAFVGTEAPFAIWNFNGTSWTDSGAEATSIYGEPGADGVGFQTITSLQDGTMVITLTTGDTITIDLNHNHPAYYSKVAETNNPSGGFLPDVVYSLGTLTGTVTFALAAAVTGQLNHYFWMFDTGSTAPTITWPTGITWATGSAPTVSASTHYEVSILGGIAYYSEV